jgi:hypothetical protein
LLFPKKIKRDELVSALQWHAPNRLLEINTAMLWTQAFQDSVTLQIKAPWPPLQLDGALGCNCVFVVGQ